MQIVMVASEVAPFSKEGGLADVLGSLPVALSRLGHDVSVISPLYRGVREQADAVGRPLERMDPGEFSVLIDDRPVQGTLWRTALPDSDVTVYLLQNDRYYDRGGYYTSSSDHSDYQDNSERFIFLSRGSLDVLQFLGMKPDIIHAHDWHTGLVPVYVEHIYRDRFPRTATVFTIHNLAYQGIFWHWDMKLAGLPWSLFNWRMLEYYGNMSFLKGGLVCADVLTTVSKKYSHEIQTEEYGCGMHGVLQERASDLFGIVNGIDDTTWNPATDQFLPATFNAEDLSGKAACKAVLQKRMDLDEDPGVPLAGMVCRLVDQKGLDLLSAAMSEVMDMGVQLAVLGRGEPKYHDFLEATRQHHEGRVGVMIDYNEEVAHLIEGGSDIFLMPSRFEPCGLNQLYSMMYGTVPVVRATGGLADTVTDYSEDGLAAGTATGFTFVEYDGLAMLRALKRAVKLFHDKDKWRRLMLNGMAQDWSWDRSAREYVDIYEAAMSRRGK